MAASPEVNLSQPVAGTTNALTTAAYLCGGAAVVLILRYAQAVIVPIVLAILIGYALDPLVTKLSAWRLPRAAASLVVILAVLIGLGRGAYELRGHASAVLESLPDTVKKVRLIVQDALDHSEGPNALDRLKETATEIQKTADAAAGPEPSKAGIARVEVKQPGLDLGDFLWSGSLSVAALISQAGVVVFLVFFLLASGDLYKRKLVRIVGGNFAQKRITVETLHEIDKQIERFLIVQIVISVLVGLATWLGLALLGVSQPLIWGIVAGVLNFIPYFGAIVAAVLLGVVAFVQFGTPAAAAEAAGIALVIRIIEGGILSPMMMGKAAGINGAALFASLLFWGWLWGLIGALVAVPIMMIVKTVCERIEGLQSIGELLSEK